MKKLYPEISFKYPNYIKDRTTTNSFQIIEEKEFSMKDLTKEQFSILVTIYLINSCETLELVQNIIKNNVFEILPEYKKLFDIVNERINSCVVYCDDSRFENAIKIMKAFWMM